MSKSLPTLLLLLAPLWVAAAPADNAYRTAGDCDGFPAVALTTAAGLCVGIVAEGLGKARGVAVIAKTSSSSTWPPGAAGTGDC